MPDARNAGTGLAGTPSAAEIKAFESQHVLQTYKRVPVVFERGSGVRLFDDQGRGYLDFVSGIGVASLGHGHPALARARPVSAESRAANWPCNG